MIKIRRAKEADTEVLALLARVTWAESHGQYIDDKNNLLKYLDANFSVSKTKQDLNNPDNFFYIITVDDLPAGYVKLVANALNESVGSRKSFQLERIFIQNEFIPLKIGQQLLNFAQEKVKELQFETMWLTVYIKNNRAIRFYEKNQFKNVGALNFVVNGIGYENIVFAKTV